LLVTAGRVIRPSGRCLSVDLNTSGYFEKRRIADLDNDTLLLKDGRLFERYSMPRGGKIVIETANVNQDEDYCALHSYVIPGRFVMRAVSDTG
jgi:hypothetical protein